MVSTVTGKVLAGDQFGAGYWWRNIREPVRFCEAVQEATRQGARVFIEVGPRATLLSHIGDAIEPLGIEIATIGVLHRKPAGGDPIARTVAAALVQGAAVDEATVFGENPQGDVAAAALSLAAPHASASPRPPRASARRRRRPYPSALRLARRAGRPRMARPRRHRDGAGTRRSPHRRARRSCPAPPSSRWRSASPARR